MLIDLKNVVANANTGLDAIKRAPIVVNNSNGLRCVRIQDISQNKPLNNWGFSVVSKSDLDKFLLKSGDVLIARTGATVGGNLYIKKDLFSVYNNGLIRLRFKTNYLPYYIFSVMQTNKFRSYINSVSCGTSAQPNLQIGDLLNYKFDAHTYTDQQHIVNSITNEVKYAC